MVGVAWERSAGRGRVLVNTRRRVIE